MPKGRPPKLKAADLKKAGYKYKLEHLTPQEAHDREHGIEVIVNGKKAKVDAPDYDYFYKNVYNVKFDHGHPDKMVDVEMHQTEVRIYHVNKDFYYEGARLKNASQLPKVEELAINNAKYKDLQVQVKDTEPNISLDDSPAELTIDTSVEGNIKPITGGLNDTITLSGGPMDGRKVQWNNRLPFFMAQYEILLPGTIPAAKSTLVARYRRDSEDRTKYVHDPSIG